MPTLSRGRRHADEIEKALHERDARHIIELVDSWGLSRRGKRRVPAHDVRLDFDRFDSAHVHRTIADVWRR